MINTVSVVTYAGDRLDMVLWPTEANSELGRPGDNGFLITNIDGLGPVKADINTTPYEAYDGERYNSAIIPKRNIVIDIKFVEEPGVSTIEDLRHDSYLYFPVKHEVKLIFDTDARKLAISGIVESNEPNIFSSGESTQISIVCPDPYFHVMETISNSLFEYDVDSVSEQIISMTNVQPNFEFTVSRYPVTSDSQITFEIGDEESEYIEFGIQTDNGYSEFIYEGLSDTSIEMRIMFSGTVSGDISIVDDESHEYLLISCDKIKSITGNLPANGDELYINTKRGSKEVTFSHGNKTYNCMGAIDVDSTWLQVKRGLNKFGFTSKNVEAIEIVFDFQILYDGV